MTPFWMVLFIGYNCPGGIFSGLWPSALQPLMCPSTVKFERFRTQELARSHVTKLGRGVILKCGDECQEEKVTWKSVVSFE